jgi:hypothetical protein
MKPKLYFKNEKGKYQEYIEPKKPIAKEDNAYYVKRNGRYIADGWYGPNHSLPEGVWIVTKSKNSSGYINANYAEQIYDVHMASGIEDITLAKLGGLEKLTNHLCNHFKEITGNSIYEKCASILGILARYKKDDNGE